MFMQALAPLVPLMLIAIAGLAIPRTAIEKPWAKAIILSGLGLLLARYLHWRFFVTVLPAEGFNAQSIFVWFLFTVEMVSWVDAIVGFTALARKTDRTPEADAHEARLRAMNPRDLPTVDVMIATYNEPEDVLEKTIIGAVNLDWPRDRIKVWVLDDGQRPWLEKMAEEHGAGYLTRPDNSHAKAGNINAGIKRTEGEFFLILDADFIPKRNFLYRSVGFFEDPRIGIVQIPHNFFNHDPMQTSLEMQRDLPDDQRFFFDAIMPGRDGWDCAFCCGSNGIIRRAAMDEIGGQMPSGSITEDMLLTLAFLRKGYITRYLNERLAVGLAPESLAAFFVQRARWARGGIQLLFLREGPLGPGLTPVQRAMFLPTHWITQSFSQVVAMSTPAIYLLFNLAPLLNVNTTTVLSYQIPAILGAIMGIRLFAPWQYYPLAAITHGVLQAFRLLPTIVVTLIRPHGHAFKVTPKGRDAGNGATVDFTTIFMSTSLLLATALGLLLNSNFNLQTVESGGLIPVVGFWSTVNMIVLTVVSAIAVSPPVLRTEERFDLREPVRVQSRHSSCVGETRDISLSGAAVSIDDPLGPMLDRGEWMMVGIAGVGYIPGEVMRVFQNPDGSVTYGLRFHLESGKKRTNLIRRLFSENEDGAPKQIDASRVTLGILSHALKGTPARRTAPQAVAVANPPAWVLKSDLDIRDADEIAVWGDVELWESDAQAAEIIHLRA